MLDASKGKVVFGGNVFDEEDRYFEPTVLIDVQPEDSLMQDEVRKLLCGSLSLIHLSRIVEKFLRTYQATLLTRMKAISNVPITEDQ